MGDDTVPDSDDHLAISGLMSLVYLQSSWHALSCRLDDIQPIFYARGSQSDSDPVIGVLMLF